MVKTLLDSGRTTYTFDEEEEEVTPNLEESEFIKYMMSEGWEEEECVRVLSSGVLDGDCDMRLVDALTIWKEAWKRSKLLFSM